MSDKNNSGGEGCKQKSEDFVLPYICCICKKQFEGNETIEQQSTNIDFWIRYAAQIVNHARRHHMKAEVNQMRKEFLDAEINKGKEFTINNKRRKKLNNMAKIMLLDKIEQAFPRTMFLNIMHGMAKLEDNKDFVDKAIEDRLKKHGIDVQAV